jgi:adenylyl cyclase-associated protein
MGNSKDVSGVVVATLPASPGATAGPGSIVVQHQGGGGGGGGGGTAKFDAAMGGVLDTLDAAAAKAGGAIVPLSAIITDAFAALQTFLAGAAAAAKKPSDTDFTAALAPIREAMKAAADAKGDPKVPRDEGATVAEAMNAFGWMMGMPPGNIITNAIEAHMFWANKVRTDNKGKDNGLVEFVDAIKGVLEALKAYVVANHTVGVSWGKAA